MQPEKRTSFGVAGGEVYAPKMLGGISNKQPRILDEPGEAEIAPGMAGESELKAGPPDAAVCKQGIRQFERVRLYMPGQLFHPGDGQTLDCKVLDISAGGAAVQCDGYFPQGDRVVLHIPRFGRFEGKVVLHQKGVLRLAFLIGEGVQGLLKDMLALFVAKDVAGTADLRERKRDPVIRAGFIVRASGKRLKCGVLDVSLEGVSLRTTARPAVGEIVNLGHSWGKVVRHHEGGFAIQFVKEIPEKAA